MLAKTVVFNPISFVSLDYSIAALSNRKIIEDDYGSFEFSECNCKKLKKLK
jgi:hypothetical protein